MARYTGPSWKQSRRLKFSVLENGKELQKRNYAPGQHGQRRAKLDNLVYRMGFATTRRQARQLVNHGHVLVDGKKVDIPSYIVKPGQTVEMKEASRNLQIVKEALENCVARLGFVSFDETKGVGTYVRLPQRSEILPEIRENLIVEFYNR